ncbi:MAG: hypothetical protein K2K63_03415 [Acetatifactor sp.]|nr:hypothetical protein [Acetatifactor sp.]
MGIGIDVGTKQDSSYLFQSLSSGSGGATNLNFLSDYASIKNGSYGKLMKAYYATGQDSGTSASSTKSSTKNILKKLEEEKKNPRVSKDVQTANSNLTSGLSSLNKSISTLQNSATYKDTENGQSASDKVVSAVKSFVSDYNNVVNAAKGSTLTGKTSYVANMMSSTAANSGKLSEIGVRVNTNGTLEVDETKLKAADVSKVQELFSSEDIMSYGSRLSSRVHFAGGASGTDKTNKADKADSTETNKTTVSGAAGLKADGKTLASDELYQKVKDKDGAEKYDVGKIFATAKSFVNNYNSMFDTAESSSNSGVVANLTSIREKTAKNADVLKQFGISVDSKGKMAIDEDTFKKSDMSKVQEFFKDYGSSVATNASLVDYYMNTQANAASGYTAAGAYNVQGSSGYTDVM